jgi:hypothetical protein
MDSRAHADQIAVKNRQVLASLHSPLGPLTVTLGEPEEIELLAKDCQHFFDRGIVHPRPSGLFIAFWSVGMLAALVKLEPREPSVFEWTVCVNPDWRLWFFGTAQSRVAR